MDAERRAHRERLNHLLERPVGEELEDSHRAGGRGAVGPEREQDREDAAVQAPR